MIPTSIPFNSGEIAALITLSVLGLLVILCKLEIR